MGRLACANLAAFPLQILLRRHPEWASHPAAVVAENRPQAPVLCVNERARRAGVLPGLSFSAALALAAGLRAGAVSSREVEAAVETLCGRLMRFSPRVEPSAEEAGVFWLDGDGLGRLYASPKQWAAAIRSDVAAQKFSAAVAVGFSRFGTYAAARTRQGITVFRDPAEEKRAAESVPLARLEIEPEFRDALFKLGVTTVGELLELPAVGLYERFGAAAYRLHRMASGDLWAPLDPARPEEPAGERHILDGPESDSARLLFLVKQLLRPVLAAVAARGRALLALRLSLLIDRGGRIEERLRPAAPTLDEAQILDLVRLRLESLQLAGGVTEVALSAEECPATREQLRLFAERPARDLEAANRALARLRAEFGEGAVVRARLADGHLPEARFAWESLDRISLPRVNVSSASPDNGSNDLDDSNEDGLNGAQRSNGLNCSNENFLIRRIFSKPIPLDCAPRSTHEDGWLVLGPRHGSVDRLVGPYIFSGGWWNREIRRDYYFAETRRGDLLWLYYDRVRRRWFLQGTIE
ncbi:MAG TPA: DNA polymerase Y family protein [candidate division Zixibacteria bacterium]|nr:DNA polymerase Y family protein [candidate division Zixibacteria bacterium]